LTFLVNKKSEHITFMYPFFFITERFPNCILENLACRTSPLVMSFFYIRMMFHAFRWRYILKLGLQVKSSCYVILLYWNGNPCIQRMYILKLGLQDKSSCYVILLYWNGNPCIQMEVYIKTWPAGQVLLLCHSSILEW